MSHGQPPGWNPPPGPGQPGGAPQPGWSQPAQQPAYGQTAQPQPGWPQQPQAAVPAYAQPPQPQQGWPQPQAAPPAYGQTPQPQPGWPQPHAAQPGWQQPPGSAIGGAVGFGVTPAAPPQKVGLFDKMPCPHCGSAMSSSAGAGAVAGRMVGGLVGWLIVSALASDYYCAQHGKVPTDALPEAHQSVITTRKIAMLGGAGALLIVVFGCLMFSVVLQGLR